MLCEFSTCAVGSSPSTGGATGELTVADDLVFAGVDDMLISIAGSAIGVVGLSPSTGGATGELTVADDLVFAGVDDMLISIAGSVSGAVGSSPSTGGATGELTVADDIVVYIAGCCSRLISQYWR